MIPHGFPVFRPHCRYGTPAHTFPPCTGLKRDRSCVVRFDVEQNAHTPFRNQPFFYCWCVFHLETLPFPQTLSHLGFSGTSKATVATLIEYRNPLYFPNKKMWKPPMSNNGVPHMPMSRQVVYPPRPFSPTPMHYQGMYVPRRPYIPMMSRMGPRPHHHGSTVTSPSPSILRPQEQKQQQQQGSSSSILRPQEQKREQGPSTTNVPLKNSTLSSLSMKFVPSRKRNLFVSIPGRVCFLPVKTNNYIQVDCEPEVEGTCLSCEFLEVFDEHTIQELVPSQVREALKRGHHVSINRFKLEEVIKIRDEILKSMNPLRNKWISLLWAEQLQIEIDIRNYDLHDIYLKQRSSFAQNGGLFQYVDFVISVPDAPEQRPHVYVGMRVQLRPSEDRFYKNLKHVHESIERNGRFVSPSCSFCTWCSSAKRENFNHVSHFNTRKYRTHSNL